MVPNSLERSGDCLSFSALRRAVMYTSVNEQAFALRHLLAVALLHAFYIDAIAYKCIVRHTE
jgi:hypothetical protein